MIIAVVVLSVLVFLLCAGLILCIIKVSDLSGSLEATINYLRSVEESRCRMQALVHKKFGYRVPASDKYLSLEELKEESK
jgi:hypothetical protein